MKRLIRLLFRKIIGARERENILDCLQRKKYHFLKRVNNQTFSKTEFAEALVQLGLHKDDTVIVHGAWRTFIGFSGGPKDAINAIQEIIGKDGTILMPAYGQNRKKLIYSEPTTAGVIAEEFRKHYATERSQDSFFSMSACGKKAKRLTKEHINSTYYFDEKSPYWKAVNDEAKILLLGLGKHPYKISLFHCVAYKLRNRMSIYKNIYTNRVETLLTDKSGKTCTKYIIDKERHVKNNNKVFKKLFNDTIRAENYKRINYLDIYLFDSKDLFKRAEKKIIKDNINIYKRKR